MATLHAALHYSTDIYSTMGFGGPILSRTKCILVFAQGVSGFGGRRPIRLSHGRRNRHAWICRRRAGRFSYWGRT
jgi:hypothetical protein